MDPGRVVSVYIDEELVGGLVVLTLMCDDLFDDGWS